MVAKDGQAQGEDHQEDHHDVQQDQRAGVEGEGLKKPDGKCAWHGRWLQVNGKIGKADKKTLFCRPQSLSTVGCHRANNGSAGPFNNGLLGPENHHGGMEKTRMGWKSTNMENQPSGMMEKGQSNSRHNQSCSNLNGWGYLASAIAPGNNLINWRTQQWSSGRQGKGFSIPGSNCGRLPSAPATPHLANPSSATPHLQQSTQPHLDYPSSTHFAHPSSSHLAHPSSAPVLNAACSANNRELQSILKEVKMRERCSWKRIWMRKPRWGSWRTGWRWRTRRIRWWRIGSLLPWSLIGQNSLFVIDRSEFILW